MVALVRPNIIPSYHHSLLYHSGGPYGGENQAKKINLSQPKICSCQTDMSKLTQNIQFAHKGLARNELGMAQLDFFGLALS